MTPAGQARPAYFLYHSFWGILDWLFPPTCGACDVVGARWCKSCQQQVAAVSGPICMICGEPLRSAECSIGTCKRCQSHPPTYQALRSYGIFQGTLREAMHRLKYEGDMGMGDALCKHLIELYNDLKWEIDVITVVPLGQQRMKERGYNQSSLLGMPLAYAIQKPYKPGALQRTRNTRSQVGLSALERQKNVEGAFTAREELVKGRVILVIDDVTTTGSTISACAQALCEAGASAVYGLTLARAKSLADADHLPTQSHSERR